MGRVMWGRNGEGREGRVMLGRSGEGGEGRGDNEEREMRNGMQRYS